MKTKVVWAVAFYGVNGYDLPVRVFKSRKKALKFATMMNDDIGAPAYGAYSIQWDGDKK